MEVFNSFDILELVNQHMVVRTEQSSAVFALNKVIHDSMRDRIAIECWSASAKLIHDRKWVSSCALEYIVCLLHFYVESTFAF